MRRAFCLMLTVDLWFAGIIILGFQASAEAESIYDTGFEPPQFALGPLNGQDGWTFNGEVQDGVVRSGE